MRQSEAGTNLTERNQYIRICIAKSLLQLMEAKALEDITITELVKAANVSRMTFYKYYKSKQEVLSDYVYEMMNEYIKDAKERANIGNFRELRHICHCFEFFRIYSKPIKTLIDASMYAVFINVINDYMDTYILPKVDYSRYELYYYAGALCNMYIKWIELGMKESPEEIAELVHKHLMT